MEHFQDVLFESEVVELDNKEFSGCVLNNCVLHYGGGSVVFDRTEFRGCRYVFFGPARSTVHFLQNVGLMPFNPADWSEMPDQVH